MEIKILGTGCPKCQKLEQVVREFTQKNNINCTIDKVQNIDEILNYGVIATPALVVNQKVAISGRIPSNSELENILKN